MHKLIPNNALRMGMAAGYGLAILLLAGCASVWQPVPAELAREGWTFAPPSGWMRFSTPTYEMFSLDGPYLQYIFVQQRPLDQAFRYTRQTLDRRALPLEVAEVVLDNLRSDSQIGDFKLIASQAASLDGHPGFKLLYTYRDQHGVAFRCLYYGAVVGTTYFNVRYTATDRHYYEKGLAAFERMLRSLRVAARPPVNA